MVVSRKIIGRIVYGGHQPRDAAAAVALGILVGTLAGGNLSFVPVLLAAILFNVHTRLFLATWLASLLLAWLSRGGLDELGRFLLDGTTLGQAVGLLGEGALVALLGWDEYALVGGLAAGTIVAIACAPIAYWATWRLQRQWRSSGTNLPNDEPSPDDASRGKAHPPVRIWYGPVVYGLSGRERQARQTMTPRLLRPCGIPASLAAGVMAVVASWSLARFSAERELWRQLSTYNGAQVSCAHAQLSLWSGDFVLDDLAIADATQPDRDRYRVAIAKGRLSPGLLLRGRLNIERLVLARIKADAARREAASLYEGDGEETAAVDRPLPAHSPSAGDLEMSSYVRPWDLICRRLGDLQRLVAAVERLPSVETIGDSSGHRRRSDLGRPRPRVVVGELRVDDLPTAWKLGDKALVELVHLSSNPSLAERPPRARILLPRFGTEVQLDFASDDSRPHALRCWACDVDIGEWIDAPLALSGRARLAGQGSFDRQRFDLRVVAEVESLAAEVTEPLLGVEPALWNRGCCQLADCNAELVCFGRWTSPSVVIDRRQFIEQFEHRLRALGEDRLLATIEQQMARHSERQAGLLEEPLAAPAVVQATAIETQAAGIQTEPPGIEPPTAAVEPPPSQPERHELSNEDEGQTRRTAKVLRPARSQADSYSKVAYPTTAFPYDDSENDAPGPASVTFDDAERFAQPTYPDTPPAGIARERPLPGPVQMAVGRDRYTGPTFGGPGPREGLWSRWTQGIRQKFAHAFARPDSTELPGSAEPAPAPQYNDQAIPPAAASEAWYNRKWR